jgi:hypothetical protein
MSDQQESNVHQAVQRRAQEIKDRGDVKVPNLPAKPAFDRKCLEENLAKMANQASIVVRDDANANKTFAFEAVEGVPETLKDVPAVFFKNCVNSVYTINRRVKNIFADNCSGCSFIVNGLVLTNSFEMWHGQQNSLQLNVPIKTIQLDMINDVHVTYGDWKLFQCIIYNQVERLALHFLNGPEHDRVTGYAQMLGEYPDSNITDQFIVRFVNGAVSSERCIRLRNGHLSTEREAVDWERRNERAKDDYKAKFLKEAGVHLNRDKKAGPKWGPNQPCPCGSARKFKKCCSGKKTVTGLATTERPIAYR